MDNKYAPLFESSQIGNMRLKNRLVLAPMGTFNENEDGSYSKELLNYFQARAEGGVGLLIPDAVYVTNKTDPWIARFTTADTDKQTKDWAMLADICHANGAKVCMQMSCGLGRNGFMFPGCEGQMVSSSDNPAFRYPDMKCRPLTIPEIEDIVDSYGHAAARAVKAEVDAIEIHAHGGYIIDQFMSACWNRREDKYGGSFENRMRLWKEIYDRIRSVAGPDFPILTRVALYHDFPGGRTEEEGLSIVKYMADCGLNALDIDLGCYERKQWITPTVYHGFAAMSHASAKVKAVVDIPVLNAGNYDPDSALEAYLSGKADYIMFGRSLIADPELPNKMRAGKGEDVRPCLFCTSLCTGRIMKNLPISCSVNPHAGKEGVFPMTNVKQPRKVAVIGGGPGGMEAALVAAERGHDVTLYEKSGALGGQIIAASVPSFKAVLRHFIDWQQREIAKHSNIKVVLNKEIDEHSPELKAADHVIVAIGAQPFIPPIKGAELENAVEVTKAHLEPSLVRGQKIIVAGGGLSGCDAALELAMEGKDVVIIEQMNRIAPAAPLEVRNPLTFKLEDYHVGVLTGHTILEITPEGVYSRAPEGAVVFSQADTVILAFGTKANSDEAQRIAAAQPFGADIVGDCLNVAQVGEAVRMAFFAARGIS